MKLDSCESCTGDIRTACIESTGHYIGGLLGLLLLRDPNDLSNGAQTEYLLASAGLAIEEFDVMSELGCQLGKIDFLDMLRERTVSSLQDLPSTVQKD